MKGLIRKIIMWAVNDSTPGPEVEKTQLNTGDKEVRNDYTYERVNELVEQFRVLQNYLKINIHKPMSTYQVTEYSKGSLGSMMESVVTPSLNTVGKGKKWIK